MPSRVQGIPARDLASGAGHDAVVLSRICPAAMLFVRCAGGISHDPRESVSEEDVAVALDVLEHAVRASWRDGLTPSAGWWRMPPSNRPNPKEGMHMRKGKQALWAAIGVVALAALVAAATAPARTSAPTAPIKAAWIYVGPHNDGGWSQAHDVGRLYVQKKLGKNVVTTFKENVPEGPQASQVIDEPRP